MFRWEHRLFVLPSRLWPCKIFVSRAGRLLRGYNGGRGDPYRKIGAHNCLSTAFVNFKFTWSKFRPLIVLVAEQKPTKNGQKRVEAERSRYYREYPVAYGPKREKVGAGQSDTANNTLCRYGFQVHPFSAKKHRELPFLASAQV